MSVSNERYTHIQSGLTRRHFLARALAFGASTSALGVLVAACGSNSNNNSGSSQGSTSTSQSASSGQTGTTSKPAATQPSGSSQASATQPPMATATSGTSASAGPQPTQLGQKLDLGKLSPGIPDPSSPVTVTFASWVGGQSMKNMAEQFTKLHPNIKISFQDIPQDSATDKLTTEIAGGDAPDCAYVDAGAVGDFASRHALVNLDSYIKKSNAVKLNDYVDAWRRMCLFQGHMYGLPFDGESTALFYRTDLFKAAGISSPPKSWAEFKAAAEKLTQPSKKQYGFAIFAQEASYYFYSWLWQAGGDLVSPDGKKVIVNNAAGKHAAEFYVGLRKYSPPDLFNSNSYDGRTAFALGKVGMYVAGAWMSGELAVSLRKQVKNNWDVALLPCDKTCANQIAGDSLVIFNQSKQQDAAWKWIEFLSAPRNMALFNIGTKKQPGTLLPPRKSLLDNPKVFENLPVLKQFGKAMKYGRVAGNGKYIPNLYKLDQALNDELGKAIYGDESPDAALDNAAQVGQEALDRQ